MAKKYHDDFISMMVKGNWREDTEDRLTQIFSACFNNSSLIRKATFEYFGINSEKKQWSKAYIKTQVHNDEQSRPDMKIHNRDSKVIAIIESKKDSVLDKEQLNRHTKNPNGCRNFIALTFAYYDVPKRWKGKLWYELFLAIENEYECRKKKNDIDVFVCSEFIKYCKGKDYMRPTELSCEMLNGASKFLSAVRMAEPKLVASYMHGINDLDDINSFIGLAYEKLKTKYGFKENHGTCIKTWTHGCVEDLLMIDEKVSKLPLKLKKKILSTANVCLVGKSFKINKKGPKTIGMYFLQGAKLPNNGRTPPQMIVYFYDGDSTKLEASWSVKKYRSRDQFLQYIHVSGKKDSYVNVVSIDDFCDVVGKIVVRKRKK